VGPSARDLSSAGEVVDATILREWYAPSLGVIVKYDYRQPDGEGMVAEATSIER
jgi:hypothetical protein